MQRRIVIVLVTIVFAVFAAVALILSAGVRAQEPDPEKVEATAGTAFTYQGRLTGDQGRPLSGQYDFEFRLYDGSGTGAGQLGSAVTVNDKEVVDGRFTVNLDFGSNAFTDDARWLEVGVREGGSTGGFTQLLPRQDLTPAPYAIGLVPGATISGTVNSDGALTLHNSAGAGIGLRVESAGAYGVHIAQSQFAGFRVDDVGNDGVQVGSAGDDGVQVGSVVDDGVAVNSAGDDGVFVASASADGVHVFSAGAHGVRVSQSNFGGFRVDDAGGNGVLVESAGAHGVQVSQSAFAGFRVVDAGNNGVIVESAGLDGVRVGVAGDDGVYVSSANDYGIVVANADVDGDNVGVAGYFGGDVEVTGNLSKGSGSFRIDHPQDPQNMTLSHSFVESPEMMNVYNGNVTTDGEGLATVTLPDYFEALNTDYRYQLTVIGTFAQAIVAEEIEGNHFVIQTDEPHVKVSWQVTGVRNDPYAQANPIVVEEEKPAHERGLYLHPEAYGLTSEMGIGPDEGDNQ